MEIKRKQFKGLDGLGVGFVSLLIILENCVLGNENHRHHHTVHANQNEVIEIMRAISKIIKWVYSNGIFGAFLFRFRRR